MMNNRFSKSIAAILLCSMLIMSAPLMAMAEGDNVTDIETINPRLTYIVDTELDFSIIGGTATADCWVKGDIMSATKAKVIVELQLESGANNWIAYATWVDTQDNYRAAVKKSKSVTSGNNYRVKATYTVWEGSQSETLVVISDEVTA